MATAPGKLFLLGEYAVLAGAPALVATVERRARVRMQDSPDGRWRLRAPQIGVNDLELAADGRLPEDLDAGAAALLNVYAAVREQAKDTLAPLQIAIDTAAFYRDGAKLGLGSSAAVTAALTAAFARIGGEHLERGALCERAMAGHRIAQGGAGSGADIAAAVHGGLIAFTPGRAPEQLAWPQDLQALAVITGRGADTRALLARVAAFRDNDAAGYQACVQTLQALAEAGRKALAAADTATFLKTVGVYQAALATLGEAAGAGIVTAAHRDLHTAVAAAGGVFKPSGAGGGDLGLAFAADEARRMAVSRAVAELDFEVLDLRFGATGVG